MSEAPVKRTQASGSGPSDRAGLPCKDGADLGRRPVVVIAAGQPGAGKTALGDVLHAVLLLRGPAVRICSDLYKDSEEQYAALLERDVRTAGAVVREAVRARQAEAEEAARAAGRDALVESALADPDAFRAEAAVWRAAGYRVEVLVVAVHEAVSLLGTVERYTAQTLVAGVGRYVSWVNHDACAAGLVETLRAIDAQCLADRVTVVRRGMEVLYSNEVRGRGWVRRAAAGGRRGGARPVLGGAGERLVRELGGRGAPRPRPGRAAGSCRPGAGRRAGPRPGAGPRRAGPSGSGGRLRPAPPPRASTGTASTPASTSGTSRRRSPLPCWSASSRASTRGSSPSPGSPARARRRRPDGSLAG
ncbi:zeta toxin family protein [Kitasatospora sp. NPDC088783]|uniref:zeta toxin family protein n=1 Tax=Kitasatospora sp. NPDC088783 TaxID=3364077 RepID=UPI003821EA12